MKFKHQSALIIDDNVLDLMVNKMMLESSQFAQNITALPSASKALTFIANTDTPPDYIFVDINMPIVSGFEFLSLLEQLPEEKTKKCKIVIISSSEDEWDLKKAAEYKKVVNYLVKPLEMEKLQQL